MPVTPTLASTKEQRLSMVQPCSVVVKELTDAVKRSLSPIVDSVREKPKTPVISLKDVSCYLQNSTSISVQKVSFSYIIK